jgi:hypothetical protein
MAWGKLSGVTERGAVLVRPDRFVAARYPDLVEAPVDRLRDDLAALLRLTDRGSGS